MDVLYFISAQHLRHDGLWLRSAHTSCLFPGAGGTIILTVSSQDTVLRNLFHLTVLASLFAVTRRQPNKANSYSKGNSRVSHYGYTYIQDCHMAFFSLHSISIKHTSQPCLVTWYRARETKAAHVFMYRGWTHANMKKLLEGNTVVFFLLKDNFQTAGWQSPCLDLRRLIIYVLKIYKSSLCSKTSSVPRPPPPPNPNLIYNLKGWVNTCFFHCVNIIHWVMPLNTCFSCFKPFSLLL